MNQMYHMHRLSLEGSSKYLVGFYARPTGYKLIISEKFFPANLLARY